MMMLASGMWFSRLPVSRKKAVATAAATQGLPAGIT